MKLIEDQLDAFKNLAMVYQIYYRASSIIGSSNFAVSLAAGDEESGNSNGIQENLLASTICYMGGVIKVKDVAKFKKLLIRTTRA